MTNPHADKRTVFTDALETLGTIIDDTQKRDAIHLAVEPIQAREILTPGQHITAIGSSQGKHIGIVDPFLTESVNPGEWFWLVVYPRQINSLRHVWTHPDFIDIPEGLTSVAKEMVDASKKWMEDYAKSLTRVIEYLYSDPQEFETSYEELMEAAEAYLLRNEYFNKGGVFEDVYLVPEFWDHYEIITGTKIKEDKRHNFFTCSC